LATLNEVIAGGMISWVLEADLKNFFGSLSHDWVLRFVEHRVGDPRLDMFGLQPPRHISTLPNLPVSG
jgi:retron-type reverse transcriptase